MNLKYKKLMKNSIIFTIANFGSKFFSFILVPFYTYVLSTAEYGTVDTLIATVSLFSPIATLGIGDVVLMFLSKKEYDMKKIFSNTVFLIILGNLIVSILYPFIFMTKLFSDYIWFFIALVIISSIYGILQMYARGTDKVFFCGASGIIYTVVLSISNIVLLLALKMGIAGYLLSVIIAYLVPSIFLFFVIENKCFKVSLIDKKMIIKILKLSIPLIPTTILWVLMNLVDRYSIIGILGSSENGVYAVAHKIPTIIALIYSIFQQAWQLTTFELDSKEERSKSYTEIFELITGAMFCVSAILMVVNRVYIVYFCEGSYSEAWKYSPILFYGMLLNCISGLLGSNYLIMKNTKAVLKVTFIGAVINTLLNIILIPVIGLYGAAIATTIGYLYMVIKKFYDTRLFTPLKIDYKRFIVVNILTIMMCMFVFVENNIVYYIVNVITMIIIFYLYRNQFKKIITFLKKRIKGNKK